MRLPEILSVFGAGATVLRDGGQREPLGYSIDSRGVRAGELFFAIQGANQDGHRFVADALAKGAIGAVVKRGFIGSPYAIGCGESTVIEVDDTLDALQRLARAVLVGWRGKVIAITGSMGKTTTKEMTAAALSCAGRVLKTVGNLNNEYGLPLSVLKMESDGASAADFDFAVLEMGMNHRGEIARLCEIAPPDVAVVTVVAPVHLEFFESVDEIAEAKSEIVRGAKRNGAAVLNADDRRVAQMASLRTDLEVRTFGIENEADVAARDVESDGLSVTRFRLVTRGGETPCTLPLAGRHNVYNALAAAAVADIFEVSPSEIARALGSAPGLKMRGEVIRFAAGFTVLDDSYNSNPHALIEMARTLSSNRRATRRIVAAGEMLELGASGPELHRETGRQIALLGVDLLIGVRGLARELVEGAREAGMQDEAAIFCETPNEAAELIERKARRGDLILVKGSRGVKTEIIVEKLKQAFEQMGEASGPGSS